MDLGINGLRLIGKRSGVGRSIEAILRCLDELDHPFKDIRVYTPQPLDAGTKLPRLARNVVLTSRLPAGLWEQFVLPRMHGFRDVLFCPSYVIPLFAGCPTLLVHMGSYEGYPQAFPWWPRTTARAIYQMSARRATVVVTISEHSKRDMIRFYGIAPSKIHVIPAGVDTLLFRPLRDEKLLAEWRIKLFQENVPFILYVGKPTKRRNLPNLIRAFGRLKREENVPHKLLLDGVSLPETSLPAIIRAEGLEGEVVGRGLVSPPPPHDEIVLTYNASDLLVYPSSYEGFGMPVLEAMACGVPAIALNNTAFPEFAGGVAELLPDAEVDTLKAALTRVLFNSTERERMALAGPRRAAQYDWRLIAQRYLDLLVGLARSADS